MPHEHTSAGYLSFAFPTHYCCQHYINVYRSHLNKLGWRSLFLSTPFPLRVLEVYFAYFISFRFSAFFLFRLLLLRFSMDAVKCLSILFKRMNGFDGFSYFFAHPKKEEEAATAAKEGQGKEKKE